MVDKLAHILQQTQETYLNVHPGVKQKQAGWEAWYAQWLLTLSDIRELLGVTPTQKTLEKLLLRCDLEYRRVPTTSSWGDFVAVCMRNIVDAHISQQKKRTVQDK